MITICADSWNSRSVLWPMMFFGAAKFPCPRANRSLKIPVNFFSQLIVLEKTSRGFPRATQHSVLRGGGSTSLCRLDCCSRSTRCRSCSNTSHCCYCSDKNCSGCCSYRQGCCIGSPRKEKDHVSVRGKKMPKKGTERRKGGKGKVGGGAAHLTVSPAVFRHCWI